MRPSAAAATLLLLLSPAGCRGSNTGGGAAEAQLAQVNPSGSSGCSLVSPAFGGPVVAFAAPALAPYGAAASGALAADATTEIAYLAVPGGAPGGPAILRLDVNAGTTSEVADPAAFAALDPAISALTGLTLLDATTLLVADGSTNRILAVTASTVAAFAGIASGTGGFADGSTGSSLFRLNAPTQIAAGGDGAVYVADPGNHRVREIRGGVVFTIAGSGVPGFLDGDGSLARFDSPDGVTIECAGSLLITEATHRIRRIRFVASGSVFGSATVALVSTLVGDGSAASLDGTAGAAGTAKVFAPGGLNVANDGGIFWLDRGTGFLRRIAPGASSVDSPYGAPSVAPNGSFGLVGTFDGRALLVDAPGAQILALP